MEFTEDNNNVIKEFKDFSKKSRKKYKALINDIKDNKKYVSGDQYSKSDIEILGKDRTENQLNVVKNAIRTITNTYRESTYRWDVTDTTTNKKSEILNQFGINFLEDPDNDTAIVEALESSVAFGLGVLVITTDYNVDGTPEPVLYSIKDLENVFLDPDISKTNGSDACAAAIVELKSRKWVESNYGIDISTIDKPEVDIEQDYDRKEYMPLVTYWTKTKGQVICYRMIGNEIVEEIPLSMTYIPVIPVFGEKTILDDEWSWTGIVNQMKGVQKLINYAYSNILVRLATSPKNVWLGESESIEGNEKYFRDSNKTLNPLLIYNKWSADGKRELEAPQRLSNEIQLGDVGEMFSQSLQMVNNVIGIPAVGLESEVEKSATEVLTAEKTFQNNIRAYIYNLKASLKVVGMCLFELVQGQPLFGSIKINMIQGPEEGLKKQEARVILQQMAPLLTEPQDQRKLLLAMANVEDDNQYVRTLVEILQPMPTAQEMQDQEIINQANSEIKQRDMQIAQLSKELEDTKRQIELKGYALEREFTLEEFKHRNELEKMILQSKLEGQISDKDLMEMAKEQEIQKMEIEKEGMKMESQAMKTMADTKKAENEVKVSNAKAKLAESKAKETHAKTVNRIIKESK
ncbi:MAG: hypothetical protein J6S85_11085 [Methanobrevibacter sp.]|nr:hypothetical protein [Methanobrevibacter sp.]